MITARVVGADELIRDMSNVIGRQGSRLAVARETARIIEMSAAAQTPKNTGASAGSWETGPVALTGVGVVGIMGSGAGQMATLESGRAPGETMPNPDTLEGWLAGHGSSADAFVVARAIGERGQPAHHMLLIAIAVTAALWQRAWDRLGERGLKP